MTRRKGISGRNVIVLVILLAILGVLVSSSLSRAREMSHRTICAACLRGTGKGFEMYASANHGYWPVPAHRIPTTTRPDGEVTYVGRIGAKRGVASRPEVGETTPDSVEVSTTRAFWCLIKCGASSTASFNCPSSDEDDYGLSNDDGPADYWDFGKGDQAEEGMTTQSSAYNWRHNSFGYQVPFGRLGIPSRDCSPSMALAADKGPYGAWLETGRVSDPGPPAVSASDAEGKWIRWNSPNHGGMGQGEGQNVLYSDGRVTWHATPLAGVNKDNIYTQWSSFAPDENGRVRGGPPTLAGREVPMGETDTLLYP